MYLLLPVAYLRPTFVFFLSEQQHSRVCSVLQVYISLCKVNGIIYFRFVHHEDMSDIVQDGLGSQGPESVFLGI